MNLLLLRHAEAAPGEDDAARPLTTRGRRQARAMARALRALDLHVDLLLHSPALRTVETAEAVARLADRTALCPELARAPDDTLLACLVGRTVALVGHQPWLGELFALLVGPGARLAFPKGGAVWLRGDPEPGGMEIRAVLPPRVLDALG
jgi:phosphohistidine phosphatase